MKLNWVKSRRTRAVARRAIANAAVHASDLSLVLDRRDMIEPDSLIAFVTIRNELIRLPYFLKYYRRIGVDHFVFIDNGSTDDVCSFLRQQTDCSIWYTDASYRESNYGVHWLNYLLRTIGIGHWCLTLDPDEFLVYPYMETRSLKELARFLEDEGRDSFFSVMLDMYSGIPIHEAIYCAAQDPLDICPWFDKFGYVQTNQGFDDVWIQGGMRRRVFFPDRPVDAPALNKTVLVKWKRHYSYLASTHVLVPMRLNRPHFQDALAPTGCILHFKYLSLFLEKVEEESHRKQHYQGSREYSQYSRILGNAPSFWTTESVRFTGWRECVNIGLMNVGCWF